MVTDQKHKIKKKGMKKMKRRKKLISTLLTAAIVISTIVPVSVSASNSDYILNENFENQLIGAMTNIGGVNYTTNRLHVL